MPQSRFAKFEGSALLAFKKQRENEWHCTHDAALCIYKDLNEKPETISMKVFLNKFEPNSCIIMRAGTGKGLSAAPMLFHRRNMQFN